MDWVIWIALRAGYLVSLELECGSGPASGRFWDRGQWSPSHTTDRNLAP